MPVNRKFKVCELCNQKFPISFYDSNGKRHILNKRKFCLNCSPFNKHNIRNLRIERENQNCINCGKNLEGNQTKYCSRQCKSKYNSDNNYQRQKKSRHRNKLKAIDYLGGKCSMCNFKGPPMCFDFHHINPKKKNYRISAILHYFWENIRNELDKCILLCANCHIISQYDGIKNSYDRERINSNRQLAVDYLGGKCKSCGYKKDVRALSFHHVNPKKKNFIISNKWSSKWETIKEELDKCKLLCENCHRYLTHQ